MQRYIKRVYQIKNALGVNFDIMLASNFILGINDESLRMHVIAFGKLDGSSSFAASVRAVKAMAQRCEVKLDRYNESSSEESSESDSKYEERKRRRVCNKGKRSKAKRSSEVVIDQGSIAKLVEELIKAMVKLVEPMTKQKDMVQEFGQAFVNPQI